MTILLKSCWWISICDGHVSIVVSSIVYPAYRILVCWWYLGTSMAAFKAAMTATGATGRQIVPAGCGRPPHRWRYPSSSPSRCAFSDNSINCALSCTIFFYFPRLLSATTSIDFSFYYLFISLYSSCRSGHFNFFLFSTPGIIFQLIQLHNSTASLTRCTFFSFIFFSSLIFSLDILFEVNLLDIWRII